MRGGGRTLNIPPPIPNRPDLMPSSSYNNGWYIGEPCNGSHCGVPMLPSAPWMINKGLTIGNDVTPDSLTQYPVLDRLGNSYQPHMTGVQNYMGTKLNPGPYQINCVSGGSRKRSSKKKKYRRH